jgi:hypothetical protein
MAVSNEKAKSIIWTSNRDFRAKSVSLLNNLAFAAEKLTGNSLDEIRMQILRDKTLINVVVDASSFSEAEFDKLVQNYDAIFNGSDAKGMVFYQEQQAPLLEKHKSTISGWSHSLSFCLPQEKTHYVKALIASRQRGPIAVTAPESTARANEPAKDSQPKNATFFEASQHVRDTIDNLNKLAKDHTAVEEIVRVGQKFNGIIGTFAFFGDRDGYRELVQLSDSIDTVSRVYAQTSAVQQVKDQHVAFILEAAKCAYLILKELRETSAVTPQTVAAAKQALKVFDSLSDVRKKSTNAQDDVDKLLEEAQKQAS